MKNIIVALFFSVMSMVQAAEVYQINCESIEGKNRLDVVGTLTVEGNEAKALLDLKLTKRGRNQTPVEFKAVEAVGIWTKRQLFETEFYHFQVLKTGFQGDSAGKFTLLNLVLDLPGFSQIRAADQYVYFGKCKKN